MSALVKLSSKLPGDEETNGLDALAGDLVKDPDAIRLAIVWYDVAKITTDTDSHDTYPTVRVRRVEPVLDDQERLLVNGAGERAFAARTGRSMLTFDELEDES